MNAVDTNVLIYAHDRRDPRKQALAVSLIQSQADGALLWQVACEYLSASRKLESQGYSLEQAWQDIRDLRSVWTTILPTWGVLDRAETLQLAWKVASIDWTRRISTRISASMGWKSSTRLPRLSSAEPVNVASPPTKRNELDNH